MSKERFIERQADVREELACCIYRHITGRYSVLLNNMAHKIQSLAWD